MMSASFPGHVFVYGTLLPGLAPPVIAEVVNALRIMGTASVRGLLYDLGAYPGCVLTDSNDSLVHGVLLELPNQAVLSQLDEYECYAAHDAAGSLFLRTKCQAALDEGRCVETWIYVYNRPLAGARLISSGRYDRPVT
jgi:gamma-glutamylcyclotransferase (GGCT)/AIG2-like uncharacterized protein YtfP